MHCPLDNMTNPLSSQGWFVVFDKIPSKRCSDESQGASRKYCPVALPCEPSTACLGSNYCDPLYAGERCSLCSESGFRVNGRCENRLVLYLVIALLTLAIIVFALSLLFRFLGRRHRRNQHILRYYYEFIDIMQTIGAYSKFHISTGSFFGNSLYTASTVLFDPADFLHGRNFVKAFVVIQLLPLMLACVIFMVYIVEFLVVFRWTIKQTRVFCAAPGVGSYTLSEAVVSIESETQPTNHWKTAKHVLVALRGKYFSYFSTAMLFLFVPIINNGLSVFNCNSTSPSDGSLYLQSIGANVNGLCYVDGSVQQGLVIFAAVTTVLYAVVIPILLIGHCVVHDCCHSSIDDCEVQTDTSSVDILMRSVDSQKPDAKYCACPSSHCTAITGKRYWISDGIIKKLLLCGTVFIWRRERETALTIFVAIEICRFAQLVIFKPYSPRVTRNTLLTKIIRYITSHDVFVLSDFNVVRAVLTVSLLFLGLGYISLTVHQSASIYSLITTMISVSLVYFLLAVIELPFRSSERSIVLSLSRPDEIYPSAPLPEKNGKCLEEDVLPVEKPDANKMKEILPEEDDYVKDFNPVVPEAHFNLKTKQSIGKFKVHKISRKPTARELNFVLEERQASSDTEVVLQESASRKARRKRDAIQEVIDHMKEKKKSSPLTQKQAPDSIHMDFNETNPLRSNLKSAWDKKSSVKKIDSDICDTPDLNLKLPPEGRSTSFPEDITVAEKPQDRDSVVAFKLEKSDNTVVNISDSQSKKDPRERRWDRHEVDSLTSLSYLNDSVNSPPSITRPVTAMSPYVVSGSLMDSDQSSFPVLERSTRFLRPTNIDRPPLHVLEEEEVKANVLTDSTMDYIRTNSAKSTMLVSVPSTPSPVSNQPSFRIPSPTDKFSSYAATFKKPILAPTPNVNDQREEKDSSEAVNADNIGSKTRIERLQKTRYQPQPAWTDRELESEMEEHKDSPVKYKNMKGTHTTVVAFESTKAAAYKPISSEPAVHPAAKAAISFKNSVACFLGTATATATATTPEISTGAALGFMKSGVTPPATPVDQAPMFMRLIRRVSFNKKTHSPKSTASTDGEGHARVKKVKVRAKSSRNFNEVDTDGTPIVGSKSKGGSDSNQKYESEIAYHLVKSIWSPSFGEATHHDKVSPKTRPPALAVMDSVMKSPPAAAISASRATHPSVLEVLDTHEEEQVSEGDMEHPDRPKMIKKLHVTGFRESLSIIPNRSRDFNWNQAPIQMAHKPPLRSSGDKKTFKI